MIGYFPSPYKNETIYSIIGRYSYHTGINSQYIVQTELFDSQKISFNTEFINYIEVLTKKIKHFSIEYSPKYFLKHHTTLPFYEAFGKKENFEEIRVNFLSKRCRNGLNIPPKEHLYFCSSCLEEQFEKHGEGYWDRLFQVPGVLVCYKHRRVLNRFEINIIRENRNKFELPDFSLISYPEIDIREETKVELGNLTKNIQYFFSHSIETIGYDELYMKYLEYIKIVGIAIPMSKMKEKLKDLLLSKFGADTLNFLNSNPKVNDWIKYFNQGRLHKIHPVRHVLLMIILAGSVKNFFEEKVLYAPFGSGPWVCMNPLSNHYLEKVVTEIDVSVHDGNRDFQADFKCDCGYVYRLRNGEIDPLKVKYFSNRVMRKGYIWEREFKALLNSGITLKELSEKTQLSKPTIKKIIEEGIDPIINGIKKKKRIVDIRRKQKTEEYRKIWNELREANLEFSRLQLATLNRAVYAWLHQYDKEWLYSNSPDSQVGTTKKNNDVLTTVDLKLLEKAKGINNDWNIYEMRAQKLIRKSFTALSRLLIGGENLRQQKDRYPLTVGYVLKIEESIVEFQKRKLEHTLREKFEGKYVGEFRLTEEAGIRRSIKSEVKQYLDKLIQIHNLTIKNNENKVEI